MTEEVKEAIAQLNRWTMNLIGVGIATRVMSYDRELIHLEYGDKSFEFNPDGYNMLYIMKTLYNNPVMEAVLE